jgi:CRP/FNR family transcriptional regulator
MGIKTEIDELRKIRLFRDLTEDELRFMAKRLEARDYKKDETIFEEEGTPSHLYIVQQGAVEINKKTPAGHRQVIAIILGGNFFGELSFLAKRRHTALARARSNARLLLLDRFAYEEMEKEQPLLAHKLLREILLVVSANLDSMNDMFLQMVHYAFYGGKAGNIEMSGEKS